ncbi:MAG: hypothetical protein JW924_12115 [Fusobacteriaceae bacterium]|nr:hypothetical protein [Fusobacteriaceae bacterium]
MVELKDSEELLLDIVKKNQPISKYSLWKNSDFNSYSTVWNICNVLLAKNVLKEEQTLKNGKLVNLLMIK